MAISSTMCGAVMVENGQKFSASDAFVNQQWLWFNIAAMACGVIGGELVQRLSPAGAMHGAAAGLPVAPLIVLGAPGAAAGGGEARPRRGHPRRPVDRRGRRRISDPGAAEPRQSPRNGKDF